MLGAQFCRRKHEAMWREVDVRRRKARHCWKVPGSAPGARLRYIFRTPFTPAPSPDWPVTLTDLSLKANTSTELWRSTIALPNTPRDSARRAILETPH